MTIRRLALFLVVALYTAIPSTALQILLNGKPLRTWPEEQLGELAYLVPTAQGFAEGVSLDELLPLCGSVYRLTASGESGRETLEGEELADAFPAWYLVQSIGGGWDLLAGDTVVAGVKSIELYGEALGERELEVWVSWEGVSLLKEEIRRFAELHNLQIKVTEVPRIESKLIAVLRAGGRPPDVVMVQADYLPALVQSRAIQSLDYLSLETLIPKSRNSLSLEGRSWAVPFYFDSQLLFYNPDLLGERPDPAWTLADMQRLARGVLRNHPGVIPMNWNAYSAYWLAAFQLGFGKETLAEEDGSIRVDDPATRRALEYLLELQDRGLLDVSEREAMVSLFTSGRVAMILSGSYSIPLFEQLGIRFGAAAYPTVETSGRTLAPLLDFKGWAVSRRTYSPILARRLLQYLSGIGVQQRFPVALSKLPVHAAAWEIMARSNPHYPVLERSAEIGVPVPTAPAYGAYKNTMWKLLRFVFSGQMGVDQALEQGQRLIDARLR